MRLSQIYNKNFARNVKHKIYENRKFYQAHDFPVPGQRGYDFRPLNNVQIPDNAMIINKQRQSVYFKVINSIGDSTVDEINKILFDVGVFNSNFLADFHEMFYNADTGGIASIYNTKSHQWTAGDLLQHINKHENLINQLATMYTELVNKMGISFSQLQLIKQMINELKADIAWASTVSENTTLDPSRSYLANSIGVFNNVKGRYYEIAGKEFLQDKLPNNLAVVDLSKVYAPVIDILTGQQVGSSKQMRMDLGIVDKSAAATINISWEVGTQKKKHTGTLLDFIEFLNSKNGAQETIYLPNEDLENFMKIQNTFIGIQVKTNLHTVNFLKNSEAGRNFSLSRILEDNDMYAIALKQLNMLISEPYSAHIKPTHAYYDAMFNFCLGRYLTQIIGQENKIILSKDGFKTVEQWLLDEFDQGKFMHATNRVNIENPAKPVGISLGVPRYA